MHLSLRGDLLWLSRVVSPPGLVWGFSLKVAPEPKDSYLDDQEFKGKCPQKTRRKLFSHCITFSRRAQSPGKGAQVPLLQERSVKVTCSEGQVGGEIFLWPSLENAVAHIDFQ